MTNNTTGGQYSPAGWTTEYQGISLPYQVLATGSYQWEMPAAWVGAGGSFDPTWSVNSRCGLGEWKQPRFSDDGCGSYGNHGRAALINNWPLVYCGHSSRPVNTGLTWSSCDHHFSHTSSSDQTLSRRRLYC